MLGLITPRAAPIRPALSNSRKDESRRPVGKRRFGKLPERVRATGSDSLCNASVLSADTIVDPGVYRHPGPCARKLAANTHLAAGRKLHPTVPPLVGSTGDESFCTDFHRFDILICVATALRSGVGRMGRSWRNGASVVCYSAARLLYRQLIVSRWEAPVGATLC